MSINEYAIQKNVIIDSDFSGYLFKIKDCFLLYKNLSDDPISFIEPSEEIKHLPFIAIRATHLNEDSRNFLYKNSSSIISKNPTVLTIANSICNLSCDFCLNANRQNYTFPNFKKIKAILQENNSIVTLEITGGEPTTEVDKLIEILSECGNLVKYIFIYSNGYNISDELIEKLESLNSICRIIIAADTDSTNSHISIQDAINISNKLNINKVKTSLNLLCNSDTPSDFINDYNYFLKNNINFDTIKITSILKKNDQIYYRSMLDSLLEFSNTIKDIDTKHMKGKSFQSLNYTINPSLRGSKDCNQSKLCIVGDKFINCIYTSATSNLYDNPILLKIDNMNNNTCVACSHYPYECSQYIGTESCKAYENRCLLCPALNTCHKKCELRGDLSYEDCTFLMIQNAFEHWLNIKDKYSYEVLEYFNNTNLLPL